MEQIIKFPKIDLNDVKGVLLDLDNTLYHYDSCHIKAITQCYSNYKNHLDIDISFNDFSTIYRQKRDSVTKRLSPGGACRSRLFAFQEMFEEFDLDNNWELAAQYEEIYWSSIIKNMILAKDASIFLKECKKFQIDICIVSDMTANIQIRKLQKLEVGSYIKYLVTSEEVGSEKPNPNMFKAALNKLNLNVQEVIMIGDSESKDIKGAEALGIKSYKISIENI
jgi:HAD superfamily hydrolase (TIGR01549 family)